MICGDDPTPIQPEVSLSYRQPDARFRGAAYEYVRVADRLPSYDQIAADDDPLCRVKLFLPGSRFTYYACALTDYDGMLVLSGYVLSPLDLHFDAFEDASIAEIAAVRVNGLPAERDLHFQPLRLRDLEGELKAGRIP
jgi:Protein of unknown function (DUF2958)